MLLFAISSKNLEMEKLEISNMFILLTRNLTYIANNSVSCVKEVLFYSEELKFSSLTREFISSISIISASTRKRCVPSVDDRRNKLCDV